MSVPGFRVVTITYKYFLDREEARTEALKGRAKGARTEVITENEYQTNSQYHKPMQDLTKIDENFVIINGHKYVES